MLTDIRGFVALLVVARVALWLSARCLALARWCGWSVVGLGVWSQKG
jgi:hypothetical protein